jgi:D-glycero-D-manno-heptose 1,7-bisphosphate phosphatase
MKPAVFFDRDGTLIEDVHYLSDPARVRLAPGAAEAVRRLQAEGFACVVITNQSAVGRGLLTLETLAEIHTEMHRQFAQHAVVLDGLYFCTTVPTTGDRATIDDPNRKPGPGMLLRAARELDLDLAASWMVGDMLSDILAGVNAGCRSILVRSGHGHQVDPQHQAITHVAGDVLQAAQFVLGQRPARRPTPAAASGAAVLSEKEPV